MAGSRGTQKAAAEAVAAAAEAVAAAASMAAAARERARARVAGYACFSYRYGVSI